MCVASVDASPAPGASSIMAITASRTRRDFRRFTTITPRGSLDLPVPAGTTRPAPTITRPRKCRGRRRTLNTTTTTVISPRTTRAITHHTWPTRTRTNGTRDPASATRSTPIISRTRSRITPVKAILVTTGALRRRAASSRDTPIHRLTTTAAGEAVVAVVRPRIIRTTTTNNLGLRTRTSRRNLAGRDRIIRFIRGATRRRPVPAAPAARVEAALDTQTPPRCRPTGRGPPAITIDPMLVARRRRGRARRARRRDHGRVAGPSHLRLPPLDRFRPSPRPRMTVAARSTLICRATWPTTSTTSPFTSGE